MPAGTRPAILVCVTLALLGGCKGWSESSSPTPPTGPMTLGVNDVFCEQTASECVGKGRLRRYDGLAGALAEKLGRPVRLEYFKIEPQLIDAVGAGRLDGVACKTWTALLAAPKAGRRLYRLADLSMPGDDAPDRLDGVFFTRADSPIRKLADLRGKTLATGAVDSYEKSYAAWARLGELGLEWGHVRMKTVPSCLAAALAVKDGQADAAVLSSYAYRFGALEAVELTAVRELGRPATIPFMSVAVFDRMQAACRERLRQALLELSTTGAPADWGSTRIMSPLPWEPAELNVTVPSSLPACVFTRPPRMRVGENASGQGTEILDE